MNEWVFILQVVCILLFTAATARMGKEALIGCVALQGVLANFFILKQIELFGFGATCSDAFAVGSLLGLNLVREKYGSAIAQKTISIGFACLIFFALTTQIHLLFTPSSIDQTHGAYNLLLSPAPRLFLASLVVFYCTQQFDLRLFGFLSKKLPQSSFGLRTTLSTSISQAFDTLLFSLLGLYGLVENLSQIIAISYILKMAAILCLAPLTTLLTTRKYDLSL